MAAAPGATPLLIAACPVAGLRPLLEQLKPYPIPNVVWLCKGFEYGTGLLPHQVVREVLGDAAWPAPRCRARRSRRKWRAACRAR